MVVAIRILSKRRRIPTPTLRRWLGMTGSCEFFYSPFLYFFILYFPCNIVLFNFWNLCIPSFQKPNHHSHTKSVSLNICIFSLFCRLVIHTLYVALFLYLVLYLSMFTIIANDSELYVFFVLVSSQFQTIPTHSRDMVCRFLVYIILSYLSIIYHCINQPYRLTYLKK